ncbi:orotidine 5'-phosphate decarboxylase [Bacillaceae bacterium JMAK1]|nr:orotidine 5'-phosphate decarboxylase [Bacillaceae bacterium JMAK1]
MTHAPLFIALDMNNEKTAMDFLEKFEDARPDLKVGMELFYSAGPRLIHNLKERGHHLFLDVKCHDIPTTVGKTMKQLASYGVDVITTHAIGGKEMLVAAREGLEAGTPTGANRPKLIAVTALTSTTEDMLKQDLLIQENLKQMVHHYTTRTVEAGLDGVVCSVHEVAMLRKNFGHDLYALTPGIRNHDGDLHDQKRAATAEEARISGSSAIVVGRAITEQNDPRRAYETMLSQWKGMSVSS